MKFLLDMIHDNPGEPPFQTRYRDPEYLASLGYNGQIGKNIITSLTFDALEPGMFLHDPKECAWFEKTTRRFHKEIAEAKAAGLRAFSHVDLFVFPQKLINHFAKELMEYGRISIFKSRTRQLCRVMIDELFDTYPGLDGLVVRVGETYLHDMPYHGGQGAVTYNCADLDRTREQEEFVSLISLLRDEICKKHNRYLLFRTWDCFPDRFHANPEYYVAITDQVEPHEKLVFSMKYTALDFWRRVRFNPCLTRGKHQQVVEVQCQLEYEGKGAYPMYHMGGVINGFPDATTPKGLHHIIHHPLFRGVFAWSRGGGWGGPYIKNEFWVDLNVEVLSKWLQDPSRSEEEVFQAVVTSKGLDAKTCERFRQLCLLAGEAVLKGRYCEAYDRHLNENSTPTNNWLRDDHLGGRRQLKPIFTYLAEKGLLKEALAEKRQSANLWEQVEELGQQINFPDAKVDAFFHVSLTYGRLLYQLVRKGWEIYALSYQDKDAPIDKSTVFEQLKQEYGQAWQAYKRLYQTHACCPTLYQSEQRVTDYHVGKKDLVLSNGNTTQACTDGLHDLVNGDNTAE